MTTLPNMSLVLPTRGAPGSGLWHDALDAQAGLIDEHDHSSGKGKRINTDAILIDADLTMSGFGLTNLDRAAFAAITAISSGQRVLFVNSADNELYWRTNAGTNVKLTSGTSLNVAAFVGGIGGDYSAVGALVAFDDSDDRYTFRQNLATGWARLAAGEVRIFETGSSDTFYVGMGAPAALASSYTVTWPTAVPAAKRLVQVSSVGVLTFENTGIEASTFSGLITASGGVTVSAGPVAVQGVISPSALSAGNNNDYNPTGLSTAAVIRVNTAGGSPFITGLAGGASGRVVTLFNIGADDIVITHEDGGSTAANRIVLPNATASVTMRDNGSMALWYDVTTARWRVLSQNL